MIIAFKLDISTGPPKNNIKDEERKQFETIMKRVKNEEAEEESILTSPSKSSVVVNARNVRFLDKVMSKKCKKCNSIKPPHSHHCSICRCCVARMDHHCPWVNNCVGFYTQKHFILFLVYVFNGSGHALYLLIRNGIYCLDRNCAVFNSMSSVILCKQVLSLTFHSYNRNIPRLTFLFIRNHHVL